jgi:hypothetical protein
LKKVQETVNFILIRRFDVFILPFESKVCLSKIIFLALLGSLFFSHPTVFNSLVGTGTSGHFAIVFSFESARSRASLDHFGSSICL